MGYPQLFLELQLVFAQRMSVLLERPYQDVLRTHTALYRIFGLDWSLDAAHPVWQAYVQGLPALYHQQQVSTWTYDFYQTYVTAIPEYDTPRWGCFSYEYLPEGQIIHLHFANLDYSGYGPLAHQRQEARRTELGSMFAYIRRFHTQAVSVQGSSWLYNRAAYTRLFPPVYGQSARKGRQGLIGRGLWGQFLRHNGQVSEELVTRFLQQVDQLQDPAQYIQCFPYLLLLTEAPIEHFFAFYNI